jgi:hypothetical protein
MAETQQTISALTHAAKSASQSNTSKVQQNPKFCTLAENVPKTKVLSLP